MKKIILLSLILFNFSNIKPSQPSSRDDQTITLTELLEGLGVVGGGGLLGGLILYKISQAPVRVVEKAEGGKEVVGKISGDELGDQNKASTDDYSLGKGDVFSRSYSQDIYDTFL